MMKNKFLIILLILLTFSKGQSIYRYGSTAVNFLEIGVGSSNAAMGDAGVTFADGPTSVYWNPAALGFVENNAVAFMMQPWVLDINMMFVSSALHVQRVGTFALSLTHMGYGDMDVTTMSQQEGTGERYSANEYSIGLSYSRKIVQWFSFGATAKLISSQIWHSTGKAFAMDLGAIVNTDFLSPNGTKENGMRIGMSISNYGTQLKYDGIDMLNPIDISPYEDGNYADVAGQFRTQGWELPLLFRIGIGINPILTDLHRLKVAIDATHPNNNAESINAGLEYEFQIQGKGSIYIRSGYKSLFIKDSQYGMTYGGGIKLFMIGNRSLQIDYAHRSMEIFGNLSSYTISFGL
jgi:hypothetical protein